MRLKNVCPLSSFHFMLHFDSAESIKECTIKGLKMYKNIPYFFKGACFQMKHSCKKIPGMYTFQYNKYHKYNIHACFLDSPSSSRLHDVCDFVLDKTPKIHKIRKS